MTELSQGSKSLQDIVYGYMPAQVLHVAARLRIADELATRPGTLAELAETTGTHPPSLRRLLRALAGLGVVTELELDRFELTSRGQQLRADVPDSIRSSILLFCSTAMWQSWSNLEHSVRTGEIAWDHVHGASVFDYMAAHPEESTVFNAAMADRTRQIASRIVASYPFARFQRLVDIGGGNGQLLATVLAATPDLRGVLFDHPTGVADAPEILAAAGVADRCEVAAGDFFDAVPEDGDAYLVKSVIHNWDDEQAAVILRNCRKAMRPAATLLLVERVLPAMIEQEAVGHMFYSDINMMVNTSGKERTEAEFRDLYDAAGFDLTDVIPTGPDRAGYRLLVGSPR
jgi:hypothetical protein